MHYKCKKLSQLSYHRPLLIALSKRRQSSIGIYAHLTEELHNVFATGRLIPLTVFRSIYKSRNLQNIISIHLLVDELALLPTSEQYLETTGLLTSDQILR